jgi:sugar O-acyltransferase (sialic acid O-acetyltransferase NeuD family)
MTYKRVSVIGGGGHAKVVASTLLAAGFDVVGFFVPDPPKIETSIFGIPVRGQNELDPNDCPNAIIGVGQNDVRKKLSHQFDFNWISVIHPFSWVHQDVQIGEGTVICAGSIIQPGAKIGSHVIINTKSSVDHDSIVGDFSHISVAHLAGGGTIDEGVFLALHSVVLPYLHVGAWATVGAGAVVTKNVDPNTTVVGIPAHAIKLSK